MQLQLLHWDPGFVGRLRAHGAEVTDYPSSLDAVLGGLDELTPEEVRGEYDRARHFYFAFVDDPQRERRFRDHLGL